jgi:hypothetical protein
MTFIVTVVAAFAALALLGGAAIAGAPSPLGDDANEIVRGQTAERAKDAALKETGGGAVTEMERDSDDGMTVYKVDVRKADGSTVDVELDGAFKVVAVDSDREEPNEAADDERDDRGENERDDQDDRNDNDRDDNDRDERADSDD